MKLLEITQFGNPVLRRKARKISPKSISSKKIQQLIENMRHTLVEKKLGVALAAPQVNESVAIVVVAIRPMPHRPNVKPFDLVLINPEVTETSDIKKEIWEGCISAGSHGKADLFAKVPRHNKVSVSYFDESGKKRQRTFTGLKAQIVQHEVDHLDGILFVDRVKSTKTFMTYKEYMQRIKHQK